MLFLGWIFICDLYFFHLIVLLNPDFNCSKRFISFSFDKVTTDTYNFVSVISNIAFSGSFNVGDTCCLLLMNQGLTNSVQSTASQFILIWHYCMPIYSCAHQKILKPMHSCRSFSPLHIAFCKLSVRGFHCFLLHNL